MKIEQMSKVFNKRTREKGFILSVQYRIDNSLLMIRSVSGYSFIGMRELIAGDDEWIIGLPKRKTTEDKMEDKIMELLRGEAI